VYKPAKIARPVATSNMEMTNGFQELFGVFALGDELSFPTLSPNTIGVATGVSSGISVGIGMGVGVGVGVKILVGVGVGVFVRAGVGVGVAVGCGVGVGVGVDVGVGSGSFNETVTLLLVQLTDERFPPDVV